MADAEYVNCRLYSWGGGYRNELGHDTFYNPPEKEAIIPAPVNIDSKSFSKVSCSEGVSCAITEDGVLYVWGDGYKLGLNSETNQPKPVRHPDLSELGISDVSCGEFHVGCVTQGGAAYFWGKSSSGCALGSENVRKPEKVMAPVKCEIEGVIQVQCGFRCSGLVLENGDVYTWGVGKRGKLGHGNQDDYTRPKKIENLPPCKFLSMGSHHCAAITKEGDLYIWGWGAWGNLGLGGKKSRSTPTKIDSLSNIIHVSCSKCITNPVKGEGKEGLHTMACDENGVAYAWGTGHKGQLGNCEEKWGFHNGGKTDEILPYRIGGPPKDIDSEDDTNYLKDVKIVQVVTSAIHSALLSEDGRVFGLGCGSNGRLGLEGMLRGGKSRNVYKFYVSPPTSIEYFEKNGVKVKYMDTARRFMIAVAYKN